MPTLAEVATTNTDHPDIEDPREDYSGAALYVFTHMREMATDDIWTGKMGNVIELLWPTLSNEDIRNVGNRILKRLRGNGSIELVTKGGPSSGYNSQWRLNVTEQLPNRAKTAVAKKRAAPIYSKTQTVVAGKCGHSWSTSARQGTFVICAQCNAIGNRVIVQVP